MCQRTLPTDLTADTDATQGTKGSCDGKNCKGNCRKATPEPLPLIPPEENVLSTLQGDGKRRWLFPRIVRGAYWHRRRIVAYSLIAFFVAAPHLRIGGNPLFLLDIAQRRFIVLGQTYYPTDAIVLALSLLSVFISIVLVTALLGRAWCGWACPQTVYLEFLFRPIDRWFYGTERQGGKPKTELPPIWKLARWATYLLLSMFLAHTFLAYFVGTERLASWVRQSPWEHPSAFLVMAGTTGLMLFDFLFFREQLCMIACPYGRFQSVMLDEQSLIVGYDSKRGEPRRKGKRTAESNAGDCLDCNQCVAVCPTGIDIRDGLQMECIHCTQCIDACDRVMNLAGMKPGLIRLASQQTLKGQPKKLLRMRTIMYPIVLLLLASALGAAILRTGSFDARVVRGKGAPFTRLESGEIRNHFSLRLVNRSGEPQNYQISVLDAEATAEWIDPALASIEPEQTELVPLEIRFASSLTAGPGNRLISLEVCDDAGSCKTLSIRLLGPR